LPEAVAAKEVYETKTSPVVETGGRSEHGDRTEMQTGLVLKPEPQGHTSFTPPCSNISLLGEICCIKGSARGIVGTFQRPPVIRCRGHCPPFPPRCAPRPNPAPLACVR